MERLTAKRMNGIRHGYWSPAKKEDLVQRLALYENLGIDPEKAKPGSSEKMRAKLRRNWGESDPEAMQNLAAMTPYELFDAWLDWEGIIRYADAIICALRDSGYIVEEVKNL